MRMLVFGVIVYSVLVTTNSNAWATGGPFEFYSETRRSGATNEWWISGKRLAKLPTWDPIKEGPPISVGKAMKLATKWMMKRERLTGPYFDVERIVLFRIGPESSAYRDVFCYIITFGVGSFDHQSCVVLMDGTVLEPKVKPLIIDLPRQKHTNQPTR